MVGRVMGQGWWEGCACTPFEKAMAAWSALFIRMQSVDEACNQLVRTLREGDGGLVGALRVPSDDGQVGQLALDRRAQRAERAAAVEVHALEGGAHLRPQELDEVIGRGQLRLPVGHLEGERPGEGPAPHLQGAVGRG